MAAMKRLLDHKVNGLYPFRYTNAAHTSVATTFKRIRAEMKEQAEREQEKVLQLRKKG